MFQTSRLKGSSRLSGATSPTSTSSSRARPAATRRSTGSWPTWTFLSVDSSTRAAAVSALFLAARLAQRAPLPGRSFQRVRASRTSSDHERQLGTRPERRAAGSRHRRDGRLISGSRRAGTPTPTATATPTTIPPTSTPTATATPTTIPPTSTRPPRRLQRRFRRRTPTAWAEEGRRPARSRPLSGHARAPGDCSRGDVRASDSPQ